MPKLHVTVVGENGESTEYHDVQQTNKKVMGEGLHRLGSKIGIARSEWESYLVHIGSSSGSLVDWSQTTKAQGIVNGSSLVCTWVGYGAGLSSDVVAGTAPAATDAATAKSKSKTKAKADAKACNGNGKGKGKKKVCTVCDAKLGKDDVKRKYNQVWFHKSCFVCSTCSKALTKARARLSSNSLFCKKHLRAHLRTHPSATDDTPGLDDADRLPNPASNTALTPAPTPAPSPPCTACKQPAPAAAATVLDSGAVYHSTCLICSVCSRSLGPVTSHIRDGTIFCRRHAREADTLPTSSSVPAPAADPTSICPACSRRVYSLDDSAHLGGVNYHAKCLACSQPHCTLPLTSISARILDGAVLCRDHFKAARAAAPPPTPGPAPTAEPELQPDSAPTAATAADAPATCPACRRRIYSLDVPEVIDGVAFHKNCLECSNCLRKLSRSDVRCHKGALYCARHHRAALRNDPDPNPEPATRITTPDPTPTSDPTPTLPEDSVCPACSRSMSARDALLRVSGTEYHRDCAKCADCDQSLSEISARSLDGILLCSRHLRARQEPTPSANSSSCPTCSRKIYKLDPKHTVESVTFHSACLRCAKCDRTLSKISARLGPNATLLCCSRKLYTMDRKTSIDGTNYHADCAKCSRCAKSLSAITARRHNSALYCGRHYRDELKGIEQPPSSSPLVPAHAPSRPPPNSCPSCAKSIFARDRTLSLAGTTYHAGCVKCAQCSTVLNAISARDHNGTVLCGRHYRAMLKSDDSPTPTPAAKRKLPPGVMEMFGDDIAAEREARKTKAERAAEVVGAKAYSSGTVRPSDRKRAERAAARKPPAKTKASPAAANPFAGMKMDLAALMAAADAPARDTCRGCSGELIGKFVKTSIGKYHKNCVKCSSCAAALTAKYIAKDGALFCMPCNPDARATPTLSSSSLSSSGTAAAKCCQCWMAIAAGAPRRDTSAGPCHPECYLCAECGAGLSGDIAVHEGYYYCQKCLNTPKVLLSMFMKDGKLIKP
ncbi:uncharacterized protein AMSG_09210 [Thecamonas trahens ATCC 50062]|uniref:LIM zinc-binding domain-containing protein n=1 Tax=Thecamonas trahens ATCC 50062 TaxID=461836 RepID=A0A0L0DLL1_THETB|nr:hypothetical protein AMSG_09210 [Thecamonas trahens ATCC 50062]KNC53135.1 hypothetical protein AMSG_09210 [Thecamonas trahens ATCC 50062]|eukprot:XP_013754610.1 hypothetical protein AMSG_09210 [Thecamonas trahens ATCC 50062]